MSDPQFVDIRADLMTALNDINEAIDIVKQEYGDRAPHMKDMQGKPLLAPMIGTKVDILRTLHVMDQEGV